VSATLARDRGEEDEEEKTEGRRRRRRRRRSGKKNSISQSLLSTSTLPT
jgi:hypothetical protein